MIINGARVRLLTEGKNINGGKIITKRLGIGKSINGLSPLNKYPPCSVKRRVLVKLLTVVLVRLLTEEATGQVVARCVTVPRARASSGSNASRSDMIGEMRYCASPSCDELTSSIKRPGCPPRNIYDLWT